MLWNSSHGCFCFPSSPATKKTTKTTGFSTKNVYFWWHCDSSTLYDFRCKVKNFCHFSPRKRHFLMFFSHKKPWVVLFCFDCLPHSFVYIMMTLVKKAKKPSIFIDFILWENLYSSTKISVCFAPFISLDKMDSFIPLALLSYYNVNKSHLILWFHNLITSYTLFTMANLGIDYWLDSNRTTFEECWSQCQKVQF